MIIFSALPLSCSFPVSFLSDSCFSYSCNTLLFFCPELSDLWHESIDKAYDLVDLDCSGTLDVAELTQLFVAIHGNNNSLASMTSVKGNPKLRAKMLIKKWTGQENGEADREDVMTYLHARRTEDATSQQIHLIRFAKVSAMFSSRIGVAAQLSFLAHSPISQTAFQFLDCRAIGDSSTKLRKELTESFLHKDYSLMCYGDEWSYWSWYVYLILAAFSFGIPLIAIAVLYMRRKTLYTTKVKSQIGWLYNRYTEGAEWWDIEELIRKLMLCGVLVIMPDPRIQLPVAISICLSSIIMLTTFQPHRSRIVFHICQLSMVCTTMKFVAGLHIQTPAGTDIKFIQQVGIFLMCVDIAVFCAAVASVVLLCYYLVVKTRLLKVQEEAAVNKELFSPNRRRSVGGHLSQVKSQKGRKAQLANLQKTMEKTTIKLKHTMHVKLQQQRFQLNVMAAVKRQAQSKLIDKLKKEHHKLEEEKREQTKSNKKRTSNFKRVFSKGVIEKARVVHEVNQVEENSMQQLVAAKNLILQRKQKAKERLEKRKSVRRKSLALGIAGHFNTKIEPQQNTKQNTTILSSTGQKEVLELEPHPIETKAGAEMPPIETTAAAAAEIPPIIETAETLTIETTAAAETPPMIETTVTSAGTKEQLASHKEIGSKVDVIRAKIGKSKMIRKMRTQLDPSKKLTASTTVRILSKISVSKSNQAIVLTNLGLNGEGSYTNLEALFQWIDHGETKAEEPGKKKLGQSLHQVKKTIISAERSLSRLKCRKVGVSMHDVANDSDDDNGENKAEEVEEEVKEVKEVQKMVERVEMVEKVEKVEKVEDNLNLTPIAHQDEAKKEEDAKEAAVQVQTMTTAALEEEKSTAVSETKIVPMEAAPAVVPRHKSRFVISDSDSD